MSKCSRCGVVETILYVSGVPICVECDKKTQEPASPRTTESNQALPHPQGKIQSIDGSTAAESTIHIVRGTKH